jgi:hypothetical protein
MIAFNVNNGLERQGAYRFLDSMITNYVSIFRFNDHKLCENQGFVM